MSTETPETKNPYQLRREAVTRAVEAWQQQAAEADEAGDREPTVGENAEDLEDCLLDAGLILLPRSTGHGKWRVLVDGRPAPYPGQDAPSHPMGAEEAAEVFLTVTEADHYGQREIVVRPATSDEMVMSAAIGDTAVREEPAKIAPTVFDIETEENTGATLIRMIDKDGRAVHVGLDDNMRNLLVSMLDTDDPTRITAGHYHVSREDATGRVELTISGADGAAVIDLGDDGDEILVAMLDLDEDEFFDDEDADSLAETCGDCTSGRCHGDGPCGCARHDVSVRFKGGSR